MFSSIGARIRPLILTGLIVFTIVEIVVLSPSSLEQADSEVRKKGLDPKVLIERIREDGPPIAPGIPQDKIPDYSIDRFDYISTKKGKKEWKLFAKRAHLYNRDELVHGRQVKAQLFDPDGKATLVTGKEARYFMNKKDLELFGDVVTQFPDGFTLYSDYLLYRPDSKTIQIPDTYRVQGEGNPDEGKKIRFLSNGLLFNMEKDQIRLLKKVHFTMTRLGPKNETSQGVPDETVIISDYCDIDRTQKLAYFRMTQEKPLEKRFVTVEQPELFVRARLIDMNYGDFSQVFQYMVAYEDVYIRELSEEAEEKIKLKYATCGKADFDTHRDLIILRKFPQVYQDKDTVTGDIIIMYRDTDIVEVKHSNAFSEGQNGRDQ